MLFRSPGFATLLGALAQAWAQEREKLIAVRTEAMDYGHCGMARGVSLVYCLYTKNGQLRICHAGNKEVINIEQWSAIEKISKDVNVVSRGFDWKDQNTFDNAVWVGDSGSDEE